jgi:hypothetical protein
MYMSALVSLVVAGWRASSVPVRSGVSRRVQLSVPRVLAAARSDLSMCVVSRSRGLHAATIFDYCMNWGVWQRLHTRVTARPRAHRRHRLGARLLGREPRACHHQAR